MAGGLVDRLRWFVAPHFLAGLNAIPALARVPDVRLDCRLIVDEVTRLGDDILFSARFKDLHLMFSGLIRTWVRYVPPRAIRAAACV